MNEEKKLNNQYDGIYTNKKTYTVDAVDYVNANTEHVLQIEYAHIVLCNCLCGQLKVLGDWL